MKKKNILILGDPHAPFHDMEVLKQAHEFKKKNKVDLVICTGDITDQKAFSRFPLTADDDNGALEWEKTLKGLKEIEKLFPEMVILNSNHDRRYVKKALEAGLASTMIKTMEELIPIKGWKWHMGPNPYVVDNIAFMHGDELQGRVGVKATKLGMSVVQGHSHKASLEFINTFNKQIFALDVGCTIDPKGSAFNYAASSLTKVWTGFGFIEQGVPHLFPKK